MKYPSLSAWMASTVGIVSLVVISACGGSTDGDVGSGGTGMTAGTVLGTVNGFGSVFVDGQRYDDSRVPTLRENAPGVEVQTEARLGDSVEVEYSTAGVAARLHVNAAVSGEVASMGAPGSFTVLGQSVATNADPPLGPVTQFGGGYSNAASVAAGDAVEVHGVLVKQGSTYTVRATRVQHLAALPPYLKVTGLVSALGNNSFKLAGLQVDASAAMLLPLGGHLADGEMVAVLALPSALSATTGSMPRLAAAQVRIQSLGAKGAQASVSGAISGLNTGMSSFDLGGVHVLYAGATVSPANASLSNGRYVRVSGQVLADGSVQATAITLRDGQNEPEAELRGNVIGFDAVAKTFQVRGVAVDANGATLESCPGGVLAEGLYVEIEGSLPATGVKAKKVHCEDEPSGATVEREGTASAVDMGATSFTLTTSGGTAVAVRWTSTTYFSNVSPATLSGQRVEVQGTLSNGVLIAQKIAVDD